MVAYARRKLLGHDRQAVFHCWNRCVRRAFLCGRDPVTGQDFSHRRDWILVREEQLASLFTIDIEFRAELSNHFQVPQDQWLATVETYETAFGDAVGRAESLVAVAERMELQHLKGITACRTAFT